MSKKLSNLEPGHPIDYFVLPSEYICLPLRRTRLISGHAWLEKDLQEQKGVRTLISQQPGTKSGCRPGEKPGSTWQLVLRFGLSGISCVRASETTPGRLSCVMWVPKARARVLGTRLRPVSAPPRPAPPFPSVRPACLSDPPCTASFSPARGMFRF